MTIELEFGGSIATLVCHVCEESIVRSFRTQEQEGAVRRFVIEHAHDARAEVDAVLAPTDLSTVAPLRARASANS